MPTIANLLLKLKRFVFKPSFNYEVDMLNALFAY